MLVAQDFIQQRAVDSQHVLVVIVNESPSDPVLYAVPIALFGEIVPSLLLATAAKGGRRE